MKLILVRHGDAGAYTTPDNERNLSSLGKTQATQTAHFLADLFLTDLLAEYRATDNAIIVSSTYNRAIQTADVINGVFDNLAKPLNTYTIDNITPNDTLSCAIDSLDVFLQNHANDDSTVIVVSHMNLIAKIDAYLTASSPVAFGLAECRVLDMPVFGSDLARCVKTFVPQV